MNVKIKCGCIIGFKYKSWIIDNIKQMCFGHFKLYKDDNNKTWETYSDFIDENVELK